MNKPASMRVVIAGAVIVEVALGILFPAGVGERIWYALQHGLDVAVGIVVIGIDDGTAAIGD